jgi:hypothetical protein
VSTPSDALWDFVDELRQLNARRVSTVYFRPSIVDSTASVIRTMASATVLLVGEESIVLRLVRPYRVLNRQVRPFLPYRV